jgi:hypothetical protein
MSYRSGPCAFCDAEAGAACPRCGAATCVAHAPSTERQERYCAICAKELKDDLDELKFVRDLKQPGEDRGMFTRRRRSFSFADAMDSVADYVGRGLDARRAKRIFDRRTPADIAEWRKRAGITVRGG